MGATMTQPHILIIEDEAAIADTLGFVLERQAMQVHWFALAREGLAYLNQQPVDLVILDVGLPDANGLDVLKHIRETSAVPVIMLTARGEELDRVLGLELGADDYVVKPFSPREVAARVKAVLKRQGAGGAGGSPRAPGPQAVPAAVLTALAPDLWQHDQAAFRIAYRGRYLSLTPSEYRILATLLQRPGQVYSRAQLLDAMGDAALDNYERTVDTHIKSLRAKLKAVALAQGLGTEDDPILTQRGFGYSVRSGA